MNVFARTGLAVFILYHPVFFILIALAVKKYKNYSFSSLWVSNLGDTRYKSSFIFNLAFLFYGILSLFFVYGFSKILPDTFLSKISVLSLYVSCLATIAGSVIPINKNLKLHHKFTNIAFASINISYILLLYPIYISSPIPRYFIPINIFLFTLSLIFCVTFAQLVKKEGKIPLSLFEIRKKEKSLLIRSASLLEWAAIVSSTFWCLAISIVSLINL